MKTLPRMFWILSLLMSVEPARAEVTISLSIPLSCTEAFNESYQVSSFRRKLADALNVTVKRESDVARAQNLELGSLMEFPPEWIVQTEPAPEFPPLPAGSTPWAAKVHAELAKLYQQALTIPDGVIVHYVYSGFEMVRAEVLTPKDLVTPGVFQKSDVFQKLDEQNPQHFTAVSRSARIAEIQLVTQVENQLRSLLAGEPIVLATRAEAARLSSEIGEMKRTLERWIKDARTERTKYETPIQHEPGLQLTEELKLHLNDKERETVAFVLTNAGPNTAIEFSESSNTYGFPKIMSNTSLLSVLSQAVHHPQYNRAVGLMSYEVFRTIRLDEKIATIERQIAFESKALEALQKLGAEIADIRGTNLLK